MPRRSLGQSEQPVPVRRSARLAALPTTSGSQAADQHAATSASRQASSQQATARRRSTAQQLPQSTARNHPKPSSRLETPTSPGSPHAATDTGTDTAFVATSAKAAHAASSLGLSYPPADPGLPTPAAGVTARVAVLGPAGATPAAVPKRSRLSISSHAFDSFTPCAFPTQSALKASSEADTPDRTPATDYASQLPIPFTDLASAAASLAGKSLVRRERSKLAPVAYPSANSMEDSPLPSGKAQRSPASMALLRLLHDNMLVITSLLLWISVYDDWRSSHQHGVLRRLMMGAHAAVCLTSIVWHTSQHPFARKCDIAVVHAAALFQFMIAVSLPRQLQAAVVWPYYLAVAWVVALYYTGRLKSKWAHATMHAMGVLGNWPVLHALELLYPPAL